MAATTVPIVSAVLPLGPTVVATIIPLEAWSTFTLSLDRTVIGGLDATPAASFTTLVERSTDNGVTWVPEVSTGPSVGGPVSENGIALTTELTTVHAAPAAVGRVRVTLTVSGAVVTVTGSAQVA